MPHSRILDHTVVTHNLTEYYYTGIINDNMATQNALGINDNAAKTKLSVQCTIQSKHVKFAN